MSIVHPITITAKGKFTEVEINRNILFRNAANANSRTLKIKITNTDSVAHQYFPYLVTGSQDWDGGRLLFTYPRNPDGTPASITIEPGETKEIDLDIADATTKTAPGLDVEGTFDEIALNIYVDNNIEQRIVLWPIWVFDVNVDMDKIAYINFNEIVKYGIMGSGSYKITEKTFKIVHIFVFDIGSEDYIPVYTVEGPMKERGKIDKGMIIAGSPVTGNGGVVKISTITSKGPDRYSIKLKPVPSGYLKVGIDIILDYSKMGDWLGKAFAWVTWASIDPVAYFIEHPAFRYLALGQLSPIIRNLIAASNIHIDSYIDQNDPTKVHIVLYQYYNIADQWWQSLWGVLAVIITIGIIVGFVVYEIKEIEVTKADVEKERIQTQRTIWDDVTRVVLDPNIPLEVKLKYIELASIAISASSQYTGLIPCKGVYIGNTCIEWWIFAIIAAVLIVILILRK